MSTSKTSFKNFILPMIIIGALFFIFGFVTWLNGILIPYLKIACELTDFQALFVAFAFYIAYTVMALPSAWVLKKTGFKNGMMVGLWVMAIGTIIFIPAAMSRTYAVFLTGLFVMGTGLALLQTASNPYVTIIGPKESAARRISILGICNKFAGAMAPLILAYYILNDGDAFVESLKAMDATARLAALDSLAARVINPYIVMTVVLILMGIGVRLAPLPEIDTDKEENEVEESTTVKKSIFDFPHLILGVLALFFYVGAEVIAGDTIINYGLSLGIELNTAKAFTSYTMVTMVVGYLLGVALIPNVITQRFALKASAILGLVFAMGAIFTTGITSVIFVALFGLANALVWPAIWPLALSGLGSFISTGSALLIMAISGGAILPLIWGRMSDVFSTQQAYWIMVPCYLFILFYALRGYKIRSWKPGTKSVEAETVTSK
ncbi:sugar MFS transporter [Marinifilum caeruleilacunae]|uniref:Glucose/galactose MFS transporter n=1 Tax=Marinifilum caeruleilacunae TaxID=2499076 RepID=A0ABX1WV05_9BACT|nr:sugar MFS transporter [Marinifilum caeruleilacunae]NOU59738.1 glucose/galactose MFS transporter [Marinifilum caeruleilacunae]